MFDLQDACEDPDAPVGLSGLWRRVHPRWAVVVLVALVYPALVLAYFGRHSRGLCQTIPGVRPEEVSFQAFCPQEFVHADQEMPHGDVPYLQVGPIDHSRSVEDRGCHIGYGEFQAAGPC